MPIVVLDAEGFRKCYDTPELFVVEWWDPLCAWCRKFNQAYKKAAEQNPDVTFGKINVNEEKELALAFGIDTFPVVQLFREQILLFTLRGAQAPDEFSRLIDTVKRLDMVEVKRELEADGVSSPERLERQTRGGG